MSKDLESFLSVTTWYFKEPQEIKVVGEDSFNCSVEFESRFPILTTLLKKARITKLQYQNRNYNLLGWTDINSNPFGWLCLEPLEAPKIQKPLHQDHILLLQNFGGIKEHWNEPDTWILNTDFALTYEDSLVGIWGWEDVFEDRCLEEGMNPGINPTDYITFAKEANASVTLYHQDSGEVLMYSHDHAYTHIHTMENCPSYTLHRFNSCNTLTDWIETVAIQWLSDVKK